MPIKLLMKTGQVWPVGGSLPAPALKEWESVSDVLLVTCLSRQSLKVIQNWKLRTVIPKPAHLCSLLGGRKGVIELLLHNSEYCFYKRLYFREQKPKNGCFSPFVKGSCLLNKLFWCIARVNRADLRRLAHPSKVGEKIRVLTCFSLKTLSCTFSPCPETNTLLFLSPRCLIFQAHVLLLEL